PCPSHVARECARSRPVACLPPSLGVARCWPHPIASPVHPTPCHSCGLPTHRLHGATSCCPPLPPAGCAVCAAACPASLCATACCHREEPRRLRRWHL